MNLTERGLTACCTGAAVARVGAPEGPTVDVERVAGRMLREQAEAVVDVIDIGPEDRVCSIC